MNVKTVTTKIHSATFSADDIKAVAVSVVRKQVGAADDAVVSSDASLAADGSVQVKIVETVPVEAPAAKPVMAPSILIPAGLGGIPTA